MFFLVEKNLVLNINNPIVKPKKCSKTKNQKIILGGLFYNNYIQQKVFYYFQPLPLSSNGSNVVVRTASNEVSKV